MPRAHLTNPAATDHFVGYVGLLEAAVWHDQPQILTLLLDLGFDPNERMRVDGTDEVIYSAGGPLFCCVIKNKRPAAELLLARGADPNASVFTSGSPFFKAYAQKKRAWVKLLEQYGGFLDAISAGFACQTEAAKQLLADEASGRLNPAAVSPGKTVAEDLIWTAAGGGDAEIVRLALERIDWPREDPRWLWPLWQAFTCDRGIKHGLACFRLLLDRANPNQSQSGRTMLHTVVARGQKKAPAVCPHAAGRRCTIHPPRRPAPKHGSRVGIPLGSCPFCEAFAGSRCRPSRGGRRAVGDAEGLGAKNEARKRAETAAENSPN